MSRDEQTLLVAGLVLNVIGAGLEQWEFPEGWDGLELREWVADLFDRERPLKGESRHRGRYRRYCTDFRHGNYNRGGSNFYVSREQVAGLIATGRAYLAFSGKGSGQCPE